MFKFHVDYFRVIVYTDREAKGQTDRRAHTHTHTHTRARARARAHTHKLSETDFSSNQ